MRVTEIANASISNCIYIYSAEPPAVSDTPPPDQQRVTPQLEETVSASFIRTAKRKLTLKSALGSTLRTQAEKCIKEKQTSKIPLYVHMPASTRVTSVSCKPQLLEPGF